MRFYWTSHVKDGAAILAFERLSQNAKSVKKEVDRSRSRNSIEQGKIYSRALKPDSLSLNILQLYNIHNDKNHELYRIQNHDPAKASIR